MSEHHQVPAQPEPADEAELAPLAERLERERPEPAAMFRGTLGRRLAARGLRRPRPANLRALVAGYGGTGLLLLLAGALSAAGVGPLGS